jgi:hypothetical protein
MDVQGTTQTTTAPREYAGRRLVSAARDLWRQPRSGGAWEPSVVITLGVGDPQRASHQTHAPPNGPYNGWPMPRHTLGRTAAAGTMHALIELAASASAAHALAGRPPVTAPRPGLQVGGKANRSGVRAQPSLATPA